MTNDYAKQILREMIPKFARCDTDVKKRIAINKAIKALDEQSTNESNTATEMMTKVYIVTSGEYSDYGIDAAFESREKAELYCAIQNVTEKHCCYDRCQIEEYWLSDDRIEGNIDKWYCFNVRKRLILSGNQKEFSIGDSYITAEKQETKIEDEWPEQTVIKVCIKENDPDKAIKIARDLVAKYDAEKAGL